MDDEHRKRIIAGGGMGSVGTVLVDGCVRGSWKTERTRERESLLIEPFESLPKEDAVALTEEGARLLAFLAPDANHDVRLATPG